jgi:hypothetical protein
MNTPSAQPRKTFLVADIHGQAELLEQLIPSASWTHNRE